MSRGRGRIATMAVVAAASCLRYGWAKTGTITLKPSGIVSILVALRTRTLEENDLLDSELRAGVSNEEVSRILGDAGDPMSDYVDHGRSFVTTFRYRFLDVSSCDLDSGTARLNLPAEVEVVAKHVMICD